MTDITKYGFSLLRTRELDEISATLYELEHIKTGAALVYLDRNDENKTFAIGFPTPPEDDTGVFHIIEHSVLCGSEKYPMRDPFAELLKGSLNTFLNAVTYPDRTIYPVSSRCEKDFLNLTDVYLDAVFAPNLLRNPAIFSQEGWHYEYDEETNKLSINGVVYNEMKGAYSSPDELSGVALNRALFSDEIYRYDSGGDPDAIPSLTYEKFKATYEKYYHPSSAKIILDGKMDLTKVLPIIDAHLSRFEKREPNRLPTDYTPRIAEPVKIRYEISENEDESERARLVYGYVWGDYDDGKAQLVASILSDLLCGSNASPLKKALLDRGLAKDAVMYSLKSQKQTVMLEIRDFDAEKIPEIEKTVNEVVSTMVTKGIEKSHLQATLNSIEFRLRERDFGSLPLGIAFAMSVIGDWIYGGLPEDSLLIEKPVEEVKEMISEGGFEDALESLMLTNPHKASVIMIPDKTLGEENAKIERERLDKILSSMDSSALSAVKDDMAMLDAWHNADESEAQKTLPTLTLDDIRPRPTLPPPKVSEYKGAKILDCNIKTNGLVYISLYFDASDLANEELINISVLSAALINFPTKCRDALSLQNDVKTNLGSLFASFAAEVKDGVTTPYLKIGASALTSKCDDLERLICEVALDSIIDDPCEIENIVKQIKSGLEDAMIGAGHSFALSRLEAAVGEAGSVGEYLAGYEAYRILSAASRDNDKIKALTDEVRALLKKLVNRKRLTVSVAGDAPEGLAERICDRIPEGEKNVEKAHTGVVSDGDDFILLPSKVAYAVSGGISERARENLGLMRVVRSILSYEYLWNVIRLQNGAYGTGFSPKRNGLLAFYSYRDPNPAASLECYRESSSYLRALADSGEDVTKFVIGSIGEYDPITTPRTLAMTATQHYLSGWSDEKEQAVIRQMLSVKTEDLYLAADIIDEVMANELRAIVGGREQLDSMGYTPKSVIKI